MALLVELEEGVYLAAHGYGDPAKTLSKHHARRFETMRAAERALGEAREFRPFRYAQVIAKIKKRKRRV